MLYGDKIVSKWVAQVRYWWETSADKRIKILAELEYKRLNQNWKSYIKDRASQSSEPNDSSKT